MTPSAQRTILKQSRIFGYGAAAISIPFAFLGGLIASCCPFGVFVGAVPLLATSGFGALLAAIFLDYSVVSKQQSTKAGLHVGVRSATIAALAGGFFTLFTASQSLSAMTAVSDSEITGGDGVGAAFAIGLMNLVMLLVVVALCALLAIVPGVIGAALRGSAALDREPDVELGWEAEAKALKKGSLIEWAVLLGLLGASAIVIPVVQQFAMGSNQKEKIGSMRIEEPSIERVPDLDSQLQFRLPDYRPWEAEILATAGGLPIQKGGEVERLDDYASDLMLSICGDRPMTIRGTHDQDIEISPTAWLLDCLFRSTMAIKLPNFHVEDPEVVKLIGMERMGSRKRYSYEEASGGREELLAQEAHFENMKLRGADLSAVEQNALTLVRKMHEFETLLGYLSFARSGIELRGAEADGSSQFQRTSTVMATAEVIQQVVRDSRDRGEEPPAHILDILRQIMDQGNAAKVGPRLLPPSGSETNEWLTAGECILNVMNGTSKDQKGAIEDIARLESLVVAEAQDHGQFAKLLKDWRASLEKRSPVLPARDEEPSTEAHRSPSRIVLTVEVQAGLDEMGRPVSLNRNSVAQTLKAIEARLNPDGSRDLLIRDNGAEGITIEMPGISANEALRIKALIERPGKFELRRVHLQSASQAPLVNAGMAIVPGYDFFEYTRNNEDGEKITEALLLSRRIEVEGKHVRGASPDAVQKGVVNIRLSSEGGDHMINLTKDMTPGRDRIAVVIDGVVKSAPVVQIVPLGSNFIIEGFDSYEEAEDFSAALVNPIENRPKVLAIRTP